MTIQEWGAIGEIIGGVAVVASLVYLAMQIRRRNLQRWSRNSCGFTTHKRPSRP